MNKANGSMPRFAVAILWGLLLVAPHGILKSADHIPITALQANHQGVANWHTTNVVAGVEAPGSGHELTWLRGFPPPGQPAGDWKYYAYYYLSWPGYDGIDAASTSALTMQPAGVVGFAGFLQALADNGFNIGDVKVEFGLQSLGNDQAGAEWQYDGVAKRETRHYANVGPQSVVFKLNGHPLYGGGDAGFPL